MTEFCKIPLARFENELFISLVQVEQDAGEQPEQKMPRQTGSMVAHHDDIVTRMKNIELIEIGKFRVVPWYFSPYPQVHLHYKRVYLKSLLPKRAIGISSICY